MNYLDLLGPKFVFFTLGLFAVACSAGDPVDSPRHNENGSSGSTGLNVGSGSGSGGSSNDSTGTGTSTTGTGNPSGTGGSGTAGSAQSTGTAGTNGAAGSTGAAGSSGAVTPVTMDSTFAMNGYGLSGTWKGYAFTSTFPATGSTATISPLCPTPCFATAAKQLCVSGTVKADPSFGSGASLGWNINQAEMMPNPVQTLATTGMGVTVNVPGSTSTMRIQISAGSSATTQWCAPMPAGGMGTVKWADFKTKCWEGGGTAYAAGTAIDAIQIVVPSAIADVPFSFCLVSAGLAP